MATSRSAYPTKKSPPKISSRVSRKAYTRKKHNGTRSKRVKLQNQLLDRTEIVYTLENQIEQVAQMLEAFRRGDFTARVSRQVDGPLEKVGILLNEIIEQNHSMTKELARVTNTVGKEGHLNDRANINGFTGAWKEQIDSLNGLVDELARPGGWLATATDIHQRVLSEERSRLLKEYQEAIRVRDEFLSIASHELKTPLTSLKLQSQFLKRRLEFPNSQVSSKKVIDFSEQTDRQVNRLTKLVDDMLDVARIRSGKLTVDKQREDMGGIIKEVVDRLRPQFAASQCEIKMEIPNSIFCEGDRFRLEQVITNLLTNALRYGSGKPIEIYLGKVESCFRIKVRDYGIGIAPENHQRIFNRFERAISANEVSGLGLGLFITSQIVHSHGGRIWVESDLGKGSTFIVELPQAIPFIENQKVL